MSHRVKSSQQITCLVKSNKWNFLNRSLLTCNIEKQEFTREREFTISSSSDTTIEAVDIKNNKDIRAIPDNLANQFPNLKVFQTFNCSVEVINGKAFKGLRTLKYLNLNQNKIDTIKSDAFDDQSKLERLELSRNNIETLSSRLFSLLDNLKFLYLNHNKIEILHPKTFYALRYLVELHLDNNAIRTLPAESIFQTLFTMKYIALSHNNLEAINDNLFSNNKKLEYVWLTDNKIKSMSAHILDDKENLKYIDVRNNECLNKHYWTAAFDSFKQDLASNCKPKTAQMSACEAKEKEFQAQFALMEEKLVNQTYEYEQKISQLNEQIKMLSGKLY